jgi:hypothetical protein
MAHKKLNFTELFIGPIANSNAEEINAVYEQNESNQRPISLLLSSLSRVCGDPCKARKFHFISPNEFILQFE